MHHQYKQSAFAFTASLHAVLSTGVALCLVSISALILVGCDKPSDKVTEKAAVVTAADPYDHSKMEMKSPPATLTSDRHTGPLASGDALSLDAAVKPLVADPVKTIQLDTTHRVIELAPGINFSAWTFGGQVPGPIVRVRVGDTVKFSMTAW